MFAVLDGLKLGATGICETAAQCQWEAPRTHLRAVQTEERVMLHACLPQVLGAAIGLHVETQQGVVVLRLLASQLNEKLLSLEGDLDDLGPREDVDLNVVLEDHETHRRDTQLNVLVGRVLKG